MTNLIGLIIFVLDIIAIVNVVKSSLTTDKKILWILLIVFLPVVGLVLYFLLGNKKS